MNLHPKKILTIFRKDLIDAIRDGRVAIAVVVPILIGVLYGHVFTDSATDTTPSYSLSVYAQDASRLPEQLQARGGDSVRLTIKTRASEVEVQSHLRDGDDDLGVVIPAGFDAALAAGQQPQLSVVTPPTATAGTAYLLAALDPTLRAMAGQGPPAQIAVSGTDKPAESRFDRIGLKRYMVTFSLIFLVGMIAMLAIPIILTEEMEKKTLDALVMIASYGDVIIGKALVGLVYVAVASVITLALAGVHIGTPILLAAAIAAIAICLLGFGLAIGGLFKSANQLNTWGSLFLFPLIVPVFLVALPLPHWLGLIVSALPTGAASRILGNGLTGEAVFNQVPLSFAIIALWAIAGYAALFWQLRRRQA